MLQQNQVIKDRYQLETVLGKRPARETCLARDLEAVDNQLLLTPFGSVNCVML